MREVKGDFWSYPADWKCIPTNGVVTAQGNLVMGAGMAKAARLRLPGIDATLGTLVRKFGNLVFLLEERDAVRWVSFPTKNDWQEDADLDLIRRGCGQLRNIWKAEGSKAKVLLPRVGCGYGGLDWKDVEPMLWVQLLEDNFVVIS